MLGSYPKGSIKGLLNYNKNHGTRLLKKHVFNEHLEMDRWGLFLLQTMAKIVNERQVTNKKNFFLPS
jgi:hypothetical protein